ncbi:hypothetical protein J3E68DRAFT_413841 [Trichoderma sp. SZMC 28012]
MLHRPSRTKTSIRRIIPAVQWTILWINLWRVAGLFLWRVLSLEIYVAMDIVHGKRLVYFVNCSSTIPTYLCLSQLETLRTRRRCAFRRCHVFATNIRGKEGYLLMFGGV